MPLVEQELPILPEYLSSPPVLSGVIKNAKVVKYAQEEFEDTKGR
jgi:hypothetical protein